MLHVSHPLRRTCPCLLLGAALAAPLRAQHEHTPGAPPLADRMLFAVLTPDTESAMLWDWAALGHEHSRLVRSARDWLSDLETVDPGNDHTNIKYVILRNVAGARPQLQAKGAAQFARAADAAELNSVHRSVWKVAEPLAALRETLRTGQGTSSTIEPLEVEGVQVFRSRIDVVLGADPAAAVPEDRYIALLDGDTLLLVTESEPDIRHLIRALTAAAHVPPDPWAEILQPLDTKAVATAAPPVIRIVRRFPEPPAEALGGAWSAAPPMSWLLLQMPVAGEPRLTCTLATPQRRAAFDFLSTVFSGDDFRLDATIRSDRTTVNIRFRRHDAEPPRLQDHLRFLFGDRIAP